MRFAKSDCVRRKRTGLNAISKNNVDLLLQEAVIKCIEKKNRIFK